MGAGKGGPKEPRESDEDKFWRCVPRDRKVGSAGVPEVAPAPMRALEDTSGLATIFKARDDVRAAASRRIEDTKGEERAGLEGREITVVEDSGAAGVREEMIAMMGGGRKNDDSASVSGGSDSAAGDAGGDSGAEEDEDFELSIDESGFSAKKAVGDVQKRTVDDADARREAILEEERLFPSNPLDIKIDGETTLRKKLRPLDDFWRMRAASRHEVAQDKVLELLPELMDVSLPSDSEETVRRRDPLNSTKLRERLSRREPLYFYRTTAAGLTEGQRAEVDRLGQSIEGHWRRQHPVLLQSPLTGVRVGRMIELALECPRILSRKFNFEALGLEYLDKIDPDKYPQCALLFQIVVSHLSQHILSKRRKYLYHREAYALQQVATNLSSRAGNLDRSLGPDQVQRVRSFFKKFCRGEQFTDEEKRTMKSFVEKIEGDKASAMSEAQIQMRLFTAFAPSLALFDRIGGDTRKIREFIDARLSLLLPTRKKAGKDKSLFTEGEGPDQFPQLAKVVQEDFITFDLVALARVAGFYDQDPGGGKGYKEIFEALALYRQLQFFIDFHLDPKTPDRSRMSLTKVLGLAGEALDSSGRMPMVSSFGCGSKLLERILLGRTKLNRIDGVDKHKSGRDKYVEEIGSKLKAVSVPVPIEEDGENSSTFYESVLGELPQADVVLAADSLHETSDPKRYLIDLFRRKVREGGYLYVSDPVHCSAVDEQTRSTVNPFDSTDFPASMLSLEEYLEILCYLSAIGAEVIAINIIPGAYAGYGDGFARLQFVLKKFTKDEMPYQIPEGAGTTKGFYLDRDEDIFQVFPLNFVPEPQRQPLLEAMGRGFAADPKGKIDFAEARSLVISRLSTKPDANIESGRIRTSVRSLFGIELRPQPERSLIKDPIVRDYLDENRCCPYPVNDLLALIGEPNDLLRIRNRMAGAVIAVWQLLINKCDIDISDDLRKQPGWRYFV